MIDLLPDLPAVIYYTLVIILALGALLGMTQRKEKP